jgi:hypothetical protein
VYIYVYVLYVCVCRPRAYCLQLQSRIMLGTSDQPIVVAAPGAAPTPLAPAAVPVPPQRTVQVLQAGAMPMSVLAANGGAPLVRITADGQRVEAAYRATPGASAGAAVAAGATAGAPLHATYPFAYANMVRPAVPQTRVVPVASLAGVSMASVSMAGLAAGQTFSLPPMLGGSLHFLPAYTPSSSGALFYPYQIRSVPPGVFGANTSAHIMPIASSAPTMVAGPFGNATTILVPAAASSASQTVAVGAQTVAAMANAHRAAPGTPLCAVCHKEAQCKCSICHKHFYCSRTCQLQAWSSHKAACAILSGKTVGLSL